jgi:acetamidase/formamidase
VATEGAMPGDVLEVRILNIPLDHERMLGKLPFSVDIPLEPFFGITGVSPPKSWGRGMSVIPRSFGGTIDNKQLTAGTTWYAMSEVVIFCQKMGFPQLALRA